MIILCSSKCVGFVVTMIHTSYVHALYHQYIIRLNDEKETQCPNTK